MAIHTTISIQWIQYDFYINPMNSMNYSLNALTIWWLWFWFLRYIFNTNHINVIMPLLVREKNCLPIICSLQICLIIVRYLFTTHFISYHVHIHCPNIKKPNSTLNNFISRNPSLSLLSLSWQFIFGPPPSKFPLSSYLSKTNHTPNTSHSHFKTQTFLQPINKSFKKIPWQTTDQSHTVMARCK